MSSQSRSPSLRQRSYVVAALAVCSVAWLGTLLVPRDAHAERAIQFVEAFPHLTFGRPLYITYPKDGTDRLFVLEQKGVIYSFPNRRDVQQATKSLDIRDRVNREGNEEGLLGLAFHPQMTSNRYVYLYYSAADPRRSVLSRFEMDEQLVTIDPDTEHVLLEVAQPYVNHNGGMIAFGPDGCLYVSLGDGGHAKDPHGHAMNKATLLGSILRIDVDHTDDGLRYAIPPDNPFVDEPGARGEIWAWGLRNVWRFSFDEQGTLYAGDVGQWKWEEIDIIERGKNYGWNKREGMHAFEGGSRGSYTEPIVEHPRREAASITGGYVYRGQRAPSLRGFYVYGDFVTGNVWAFKYERGRVLGHRRIGKSQLISSFGEDRGGELYFTSFNGKIYTLEESANP